MLEIQNTQLILKHKTDKKEYIINRKIYLNISMLRNTLTINDPIISNQKQDYQIKESPNYACSSRKHYTYIEKNLKRKD